MATRVVLLKPGLVPYEEAWLWQRNAAADLREGGPERLFLLQHPPVYTLGRRARADSLRLDPSRLAALGADVMEVDRGGDVTFHGPGQLVAYPILDLRARRLGPTDYVRALEAVVIDALAAVGLAGERVAGLPGVWAGGAKVCAIGVRVQAGVSTHGFALNVETDLRWFDHIVPCGLPDVSVTSIRRLGVEADMGSLEDAIAAAFAQVFRCECAVLREVAT